MLRDRPGRVRPGTGEDTGQLLRMLALEPRFMFDAAGVATGADVALEASAEAEAQAVSLSAEQRAGQAEDAALVGALETHVAPGARQDVVIVDSAIGDYQSLLLGMDPEVEVIVLARDAMLDDVAAALEGYGGLDAVHLITHGGIGALYLGGESVNLETLADNAAALRTIGGALSDSGDLLLYGCNVGADGRGRDFLQALAGLTDADVAASNDATGARALGGDWELETQIGEIRAGMAVSELGRDAFRSLLATFDFESNTTDNGATVSSTVSGVTVTLANADNQLNIVDLGPTYTKGNGTFAFTVGSGAKPTTFTFSAAVDLTSIRIARMSGPPLTLSVVATDGSGNPTVQLSAADAGTGKDVTLNWTGVTSFEVQGNNFNNQQLLFDDIVFTPTPPNAAPALGGTPADVTVTEDVATAIDLSAYNVSDADGDTITLTLAVDAGTVASIDGNGTTGGVTVANSGTGSMTLQGSAANLNTYLNNTAKITYTTAQNDTASRTLTVTPNDGNTNGTADTVTINVTAVNDGPGVSGLPASVTVTEDTESDIALGAASFADVDSGSITVTLTASAGTFAIPADGAGVGGGVTETRVGATVITLAGAPADINTYLDTASNIRYTGAANAAGTAAATITVTANDGDGSGNVNLGTVNVDVTAVNDSPVLTGYGPDAGNVAFITGGTVFVALDSGTAADASDLELDALNGGNGTYNGATITFARNGGVSADDRFGPAGGTAALDNGDAVTIGGTVIGRVTAGGAAAGTITITLDANASSAGVDGLLRNIGYANVEAAASGIVTIDVTLNDGNTGTQGTGGAGSVTRQVSVAIGNRPVIGGLTGDSATFREDGGPVALDTGGDATLSDRDNPASLSGGNLTATVSANAVAAQDLLTFVSGAGVVLAGTAAGSAVSVDGTAIGTLGNAVAAGNDLVVNFNTSATLARVQSLLRAVAYDNTSDNPDIAQRTVSLTLTDDAGATSGAAAATVSVTRANDAPGAAGVPDDVNVIEDLASDFDLSAVNFSDPEGDDLSVTLSSSSGRFSAASAGGVTVTGSDSGSITLRGSIGDLHTYLDTVSNIRYTGATDLSGDNAATFTLAVSDGATGAQAIAGNIDIEAVDDPPVMSGTDPAKPAQGQAGVPVLLAPDITIADNELDLLGNGEGNYENFFVTVQRSLGAVPADVFGFRNSVNITRSGDGTALVAGGNRFATFDTATPGRLAITFSAAGGTVPTTVLVNETLRHLTFTTALPATDGPVSLTLTTRDRPGAEASRSLTLKVEIVEADFVPPSSPPSSAAGNGGTAGTGLVGLQGPRSPEGDTPIRDGIDSAQLGSEGGGLDGPAGMDVLGGIEGAVTGQLGSRSPIENTGTPVRALVMSMDNDLARSVQDNGRSSTGLAADRAGPVAASPGGTGANGQAAGNGLLRDRMETDGADDADRAARTGGTDEAAATTPLPDAEKRAVRPDTQRLESRDDVGDGVEDSESAPAGGRQSGFSDTDEGAAAMVPGFAQDLALASGRGTVDRIASALNNHVAPST